MTIIDDENDNFDDCPSIINLGIICSMMAARNHSSESWVIGEEEFTEVYLLKKETIHGRVQHVHHQLPVA